MIQPLISVIIPVYNAEKYLSLTLDSILNNTYQNLEIVCVNDGSTDGTASVLAAYAKQDDRIRVVEQSNCGVSAARNTCLTVATGEFIAFVDSDDLIHKKYFEILYDGLVGAEADIAFCGYKRIQKSSQFQQNADIDCIPEPISFNWHRYKLAGDVLKKNAVVVMKTVWGKLFRTAALEDVHFDSRVPYGEDLLYMLQVNCLKEPLACCFIDLPLYAYYIHENNSASYNAFSARINKALYGMEAIQAVSGIESNQKEGYHNYVMTMIKAVLEHRYELQLRQKVSKEELQRLKGLMKEYMRCGKRLGCITGFERLYLRFFVHIPQLFRLVCLMKGTRAYEKSIKAAR